MPHDACLYTALYTFIKDLIIRFSKDLIIIGFHLAEMYGSKDCLFIVFHNDV